MPTRRAVVVGGAAFVAERLLSSCGSDKRKPSAPSSAGASGGSGTKAPEGPPVIQLERPNATLPAAVGRSALSVVRVRADGQPENARNVMSGVRVGPREYLAAGHLLLGENGQNLMSRCAGIRVAGRTGNGAWVVRNVVNAAPIRDVLTDVILLQTDQEMNGATVARFSTGPVAVGSTVFFSNHRPRPNEDRFARPITDPAPRAIWDGFVLSGDVGTGQSQFQVLTGVGKSYGDFEATSSVEGASGGPLFTTDGLLLGTVQGSEMRPAGEIQDEFKVVLRRGSKAVASNTSLQVTTVQGANDALMSTLRAIQEPLRNC